MVVRKNRKILAFFAALVFSLVFSLLYKWAQTGNPFSAETIVYGSIFFINLLVLGTIALRIWQKLSGKNARELQKSILPMFLLFTLVALFVSLLLVSIGVYVFYLVEGLDRTDFIRHLFRVELSGALKQFSIWIVISSAVTFYIIWRKAIDREQKLREENLKYRYRSLKSQVNPHFLFNSLNTLSEMIYDDAEKADRYIQQLSGIYRYILEHEETDLVPLEEELQFVEQFFSLQKERDQDTIRLIIQIHEPQGIRIIPVSLQMLVENALKHNARSGQKPLEISIERRDRHIVVSNNVQRKDQIDQTLQSGLSNLRERVKLIMGEELMVSEENNVFVVKLPVLID